MERQELLQKQNRMLTCLANLPRKILSLYDVDNITEFVLHDLCHEHCFNLNKAAYFVDNPDFDCMKGVVGFSRDQLYEDYESIWQKPDLFSDHMHASEFNKKVRDTYRCSMQKSSDSNKDLATTMARELNFKNHVVCTWNTKHHNHGLVIYEKADVGETFADDYILNGLSFLSFCPVF